METDDVGACAHQIPRDVIIKQADKITEKYISPPIPVCEIARSLGMTVYETDFGDLDKELSGFCDLTAGEIYVNKEELRFRQVFTIAHEIGHYVLHKEGGIGRRHSYLPRRRNKDFDDSPVEKEADVFAEALLVPRHLLANYDLIKDHAALLAKVFNVERSMMDQRLSNV